MGIPCPRCHSQHTIERHYGKKTGSALGTTAGFIGGFTAATKGARVGSTIGLIAGPAGSIFGGLSGAIIGGLLGGFTGGVAGSKLGEFVDNEVLNSHECLNCRHTFNAPSHSKLLTSQMIDQGEDYGEIPYDDEHPHQ